MRFSQYTEANCVTRSGASPLANARNPGDVSRGEVRGRAKQSIRYQAHIRANSPRAADHLCVIGM